ncbi:MAG TPA: ion transporter [Rhodothermales bacterium]|nr:ion transporter [Rhodothermales bacterium]
MLKPNPIERRLFGADRLHGWRLKLYIVIFESDTRGGKAFDVALIWVIIASVVVVMLESIDTVRTEYGDLLYLLEWGFTILFTIEYVLRLLCVGRPVRYAISFFGIVDLLAVIPTYLSLIIPGAQFLLVIRLLRILRVFRVLKLVHYLSEADVLMRALRESRRKITLFLFAVLTLVVILGSLMYLIEGAENGFTSIPRSIYWAIVTLTTVGYGDISPQTNVGQTLAAFIMLIGYAIIAVPTGIVTAEITRAGQEQREASVEHGTRALICPSCYAAGHDDDARFCKNCGTRL